MSLDAGQPRKRWTLMPLLRGAHVLLRVMAVAVVVVAGGFFWFLAQLESDEAQPKSKADGIVVLTGGSSRVSDAVELLANGYGKRLLISGVHWSNGAGEISRSLPDNRAWLACCIDLDYSAVNTRSNATETRRWVQERGFRSLIVVTSNYHMPRALNELSHTMPDTQLIPFAVIGEKWRDEPWWSSGAAARLLLTEYAKFLVAGLRMHLDDWLDPPEFSSGDGVTQSPVVSSRKPASGVAN